MTPATLKQRLAKFGTAFKHNSNSSDTNKPEADTQNAKKKKGLRKSMSLWNIGGKKKGFNDLSNDPAPKPAVPQVPAVPSTSELNFELLNKRKRKAKEEYAKQFGMKKRKSAAGFRESTTEGESEDLPSPKRHQPESQRGRRKSLPSTRQTSRSLSNPVNTPDGSMSHADVEHHKRPSRRELEKENQQLREMLRQQQRQTQRQSSSNYGREPSSPVTPRPLPVPPEKSTSTADDNPKQIVKTPVVKSQADETSSIPPVPAIPERAALRTLSKGQNTSVNSNANVIANNNGNSKSNTNQNSESPSAKRIIGGAGFPRPISMILEEDEEGVEHNTPDRSKIAIEIQKLKEPSPSPLRSSPLRLQGMKREHWEWPEDVF